MLFEENLFNALPPHQASVYIHFQIMSQSTRKRAHSSNESIHYALNDYDRHRRPQTLIDDDRIQRVSIEPVLKSLSVKNGKDDPLLTFDATLSSVPSVSISSIKRWSLPVVFIGFVQHVSIGGWNQRAKSVPPVESRWNRNASKWRRTSFAVLLLSVLLVCGRMHWQIHWLSWLNNNRPKQMI